MSLLFFERLVYRNAKELMLVLTSNLVLLPLFLLGYLIKSVLCAICNLEVNFVYMMWVPLLPTDKIIIKP